MNYYNENDPKAAAWLRQLIAVDAIPAGYVDERSICDVRPADLAGYTQCHFFAGVAGWSYALRLAGWPDDRPVWTGSCPCQPFSAAGKGKGAADERHLWPVFRDLIRECRPQHVFGEQVANAVGHGWLDGVSADLEAEGYAVGAVVLGAHSVGAPHIRQRLYWMADAERDTRGPRWIADESREGIGEAGTSVESGRCGDACRLGDASGDNERRDSLPGENREGLAIGGSGCAGGMEHATCGGTGATKQPRRWVCAEPPSFWSMQSGRAEGRTKSGRGSTAGSGGAGWSRVVHASECDDDGNCPVCGIDFGECGCFGPTQDDVEYDERPDGLYARWMVQSGQPGLEGHAGNGDNRNQPRRIGAQPIGPTSETSGLGAWSDFRIVRCLDGKARRIGTGIQPLAHGVPGRVGLLRGYGNAIVPQVAAEFVKAFNGI